MCPNIVQRAVAVADLASARLCEHNTSCIRQPRQALGIIGDTLLDVTITMHLDRARGALAAGDREAFGRRCEHADRLARRHAPGRIDEIEALLETGLD